MDGQPIHLNETHGGFSYLMFGLKKFSIAFSLSYWVLNEKIDITVISKCEATVGTQFAYHEDWNAWEMASLALSKGKNGTTII